MKKFLPIAIIAVAATMFTSCKKDYTCTCTYTDNGTVVGTVTATIHDTKSHAQSACNNTVNMSAYGSSATVSCHL